MILTMNIIRFYIAIKSQQHQTWYMSNQLNRLFLKYLSSSYLMHKFEKFMMAYERFIH